MNDPVEKPDILLPEEGANRERILALHKNGVRFPCGTQNIFLGEEVDLKHIEAEVSLYPGCRIRGRDTLLRSGAEIGFTGPCSLDNMVLDRRVRLGSGVFEHAVLLHGVKLGSAIRVRENCLLEEGCEMSFSADVKETFLLAHVVLGSEINFCDLLMAGGTGRRDHSEVGSGVIHFNFTPFGRSGDKTTASLVGDAVHGVFYRSKRIFIGGHASLVGPVRIGYGSVIAAGARIAKDVEEDTLSFGEQKTAGDITGFDFLRYKNIRRKVMLGVNYIAQLAALWHWYHRARTCTAGAAAGEKVLHGAREVIQRGINTRLDRMDKLNSYMPDSIGRNKSLGEERLAAQQEAFLKGWPPFRDRLLDFKEIPGDQAARDAFLPQLEKAAAGRDDFTACIKEGLREDDVAAGTRWLQSIVDALSRDSSDLAPPLV
jgi:UDP-N-acetylglucosamine/UDP-N-acetylgalactosamine diphosphorylase